MQKAAPEAASWPAAFTIELGKPAVGGGAVWDVWVARKLLRRGSSRGVKSGSRRYHNFNLYCAGFGPFWSLLWRIVYLSVGQLP